ncbi:MAG: hypothetical protein JWQ30_1056 [Sediminibacterium sp.]|nr:hypothetical protein [Sediminibacterium sp.]
MKSKLSYFFFVLLFLQTFHARSQDNIVNKPAKNTARVPIPEGATVVGVFDGRSPCQEIAKELNVKAIPECIKIKWRLILYRDSITQAPTRYHLEGFVYRNPPREGKWSIVRGTANDPNAEVIQLDPDKQSSMFFFKADDNVLFILDNKKKLMPGNDHFSYVLYRTEN